MAKAEREEVAALASGIKKYYQPVIVKEPAKTLTMIKVRDPVRRGMFYIGEVIVCEAQVEIDGEPGLSVMMGDDEEKALNAAIIDAAVNKGVFGDIETLTILEEKQNQCMMRENALYLRTMVNFESMDQEAPDDLNAYKKA